MRPGRVGWDCIGTGRFPLRFPQKAYFFLFPPKTPLFRCGIENFAKKRAPPAPPRLAGREAGGLAGWKLLFPPKTQ